MTTVYSDNHFIETQLTYGALVTTPTSQATANSTLSFTLTSNKAQYFTGSTVGQIVKMPDATTLSVGQRYELYNTSTVAITINDSAGTLLYAMPPNSLAHFTLQTNGTAAGTWLFWSLFINAAGIITYNLVASATFTTASTTDVQITGFSLVPQQGTYQAGFSCNSSNTGSGADNTCTIYVGTTPVADSARTSVGPAGTHNLAQQTQTLATWDGVKVATVYVRTGGSLTVTGRSLLLLRTGN